MTTYYFDNFDIRQIALSGQCFRMREIADNLWQIIAVDKCILLHQDEDRITVSCSEDDFEGFWKEYFDLNRDYQKLIKSIDKNDAYLNECADFGSGIRILKQNLWEMLITFLISQNNNIPRIKNSVSKLCDYAGKKCTLIIPDDFKSIYNEASITYSAFPTPDELANVPIDILHSFGLGYRDEYLHLTGLKVASGEFDLSALYEMNYAEAAKTLISLKGVGKKVADCVCLFGLNHVEAFPIDTHIKQILAEQYPDGFPFERYEGYAGILQQYMFFAHL